jgi:hypothetical protein
LFEEVDSETRLKQGKDTKKLSWSAFESKEHKDQKVPTCKDESSDEQVNLPKITVHRKPFKGKSILKTYLKQGEDDEVLIISEPKKLHAEEISAIEEPPKLSEKPMKTEDKIKQAMGQASKRLVPRVKLDRALLKLANNTSKTASATTPENSILTPKPESALAMPENKLDQQAPKKEDPKQEPKRATNETIKGLLSQFM